MCIYGFAVSVYGGDVSSVYVGATVSIGGDAPWVYVGDALYGVVPCVYTGLMPRSVYMGVAMRVYVDDASYVYDIHTCCC